jgi:hypothetical protein
MLILFELLLLRDVHPAVGIYEADASVEAATHCGPRPTRCCAHTRTAAGGHAR